MIPVKTNITQVDNLPGEEIEFSIGDPRFVMQTQADLYSNRELAVVREYSTNGYDANIEKALADGTKVAPLEVTLPSVMSPYFKVRDRGTGMSPATLRDTYTKFGTSTKRNSNAYNGTLGYGSKSAVAYTDTFTVTSVNEGIKSVAVITRKPDWSIVMRILSQTKTDEASGTEIVVPVHNWDEFTHKANDFYKFWLPGTVLVNGREPIHEVGEKIVDNLYYSKNHNTSYVVMGNVPYRINNPSVLFQGLGINAINFVAYTDNGNVEFTPSREDLKYTEHTKNSLRHIIKDFADGVVEKAKKDIAAASTHADAFAAYTKWTGIVGKAALGDLTYKGDKLSNEFSISAQRYDSYRTQYNTHGIRSWTIDMMCRSLIIVNHTGNMNSHHKRHAREYASLKKIYGPDGRAVRYYIFTTADKVDNIWVDQSRVVDWSDLKAALPKKPPKPRAQKGSRPKGVFDYYHNGTWHEAEQLPTQMGELFYVRARQRSEYNLREIAKLIGLKDYTIVSLAVSRINKFTRENPSVKDFISYGRSKVVIDASTLLSDEEKFARDLTYRRSSFLTLLDPDKVDDPEVVKAIKVYKANPSATSKAYEANLSLAREMRILYNVKEYSPKGVTVFGKYKLLSVLNVGYNTATWNSVADDVYTYMNAIYRKDAK